MKPIKDKYCSFCRAEHTSIGYPKTCPNPECGIITYANPIPVIVAVIPVDLEQKDGFLEPHGLLVIRRGNHPGYGELALPGGYMELGESWQEACAREIKEEIGLDLDVAEIHPFNCRGFDSMQMAESGNLILFAKTEVIRLSQTTSFIPNDEVMELKILQKTWEDDQEKLCFPTHDLAMQSFFSEHSDWWRG